MSESQLESLAPLITRKPPSKKSDPSTDFVLISKQKDQIYHRYFQENFCNPLNHKKKISLSSLNKSAILI